MNADNWGVSETATVQFALSWLAPFYLDYVDKFSMISSAPQFNLEVISDLSLTLHFGVAELTFAFKLYPFKFTPFDIMLRMDPLHPKRYCTGMDYRVRTLLFDLMVEWKMKECNYGIVGMTTENDKSDCWWRSYKPQLPLYSYIYENIGNMQGTYFQYRCANWYSAGWDNFPYSDEFLSTHGLE